MFSWVDHSESLVFKHNCLFDVSFRSPNGPDKGKIIEYFTIQGSFPSLVNAIMFFFFLLDAERNGLYWKMTMSG